MKKIIYTLMAAATLASCSASNTFKISTTLPMADFDGEQVIMIDLGGQNDTLATSQIKDGKFELTGTITEPTICLIKAADINFRLPAQAGETTVVFDETGNPTISGNALAEAFAKVESDVMAVQMAFSDFYKANPDDQEALGREYEKMNQESKNIYSKAMDANLDNILGAYCFDQVLVGGDLSVSQIDSMVNIVKLAGNYQPIADKRSRLVALEATSAGAKFVDFDGTAIDGSKSSLSDYVGKGEYVLVDFWASWCGPCKGEIPNLKEVHELYKDKGFVMLGVNVWDKHEAFLEAIEHEGMTWNHIYASDDRTATDKYGISGIPTIILFAPDGTIVDRTLRGEAIKAKLSEIYE